jgi:hypothetical protein
MQDIEINLHGQYVQTTNMTERFWSQDPVQ